jgi:hypothetical protein
MGLLSKDSAGFHLNNGGDKPTKRDESKSTTTYKTISSDALGFMTVKECPLCKGQNGHIEDLHSTVPFCPVCMEKLRELIGLKK